MSQEITTNETAKRMAKYDEDAAKWKHTQSGLSRAAWFCLAFGLLLVVLSYYAAGFEGPVNRSAWLTVFTLVSFVGGVGLLIGFAGCCLTKAGTTPPVRPSTMIDITRRD